MGCTCSRGARRRGVYSGRASNHSILDRYKIGRVLGSGAFGEVRECIDRKDRKAYAVKIMEKRGEGGHWSNENMFRREVAVLVRLNHPNIVDFYDFFEDQHFLYAVMEKCEGGELFEHLVRLKHFNEKDAAVLCHQMLLSLEHVHSKDITHRDVKAENFLFRDKNCSSPLKLIDFGMSAQNTGNAKLSEICGSPHYLSPELIHRNYNRKADMWALGVLVYLLLFGRYPFDGPNTKAIIRGIINDPIRWRSRHVNPSADATDFMQSLLQRDPEKRLDATRALQHPWVADKGTPSQVPDVGEDLSQAVRSAHRKVTLTRKLATAADEARREMLLKEVEHKWLKGEATGVHLSTLNRDGPLVPQFRRHNNRTSTTPSNMSERMAAQTSTRSGSSAAVSADEQQNPGLTVLKDVHPAAARYLRAAQAAGDGTPGAAASPHSENGEDGRRTGGPVEGYSQFSRGKGRAYTIEYTVKVTGVKEEEEAAEEPEVAGAGRVAVEFGGDKRGDVG